MKPAIGGITIFQLVIIFILFFTAIMCLTINHAKAFQVKDSIINLIQDSEYSTGNEIDHTAISSLLADAGYRITGESCPSGWSGFDREGNPISSNVSYCLRKVSLAETFVKDASDKCNASSNCVLASNVYPNMFYYDVMVFYQLDIPGLNRLMNFSSTSSTKIMIGE